MLVIFSDRRLVMLRRVARLVLRQAKMNVSGNLQMHSSRTPLRCTARSVLSVHPLFMAVVAAMRGRRRGHTQAMWKFISRGDSSFKSVWSERRNGRRSKSSLTIIWDMRDGLRTVLNPTLWLYSDMRAKGRMVAILRCLVRVMGNEVELRKMISAIDGQLGTRAMRARRDTRKRVSAVKFLEG